MTVVIAFWLLLLALVLVLSSIDERRSREERVFASTPELAEENE